MRRRVSVFGAAALASSLLALAAAACSLGLDESLIDKGKDAGFSAFDGTTPDVVSPADDAGSDATTPPPATGCSFDQDCTSTDACLKGKCDVTRKRCVFEVCRPSACMASACSEPNHACAPAAPYKLQASQFAVDAVLPRGAVAIHPWLYLATPLGVVAYDVSNPASSKPRQVPVVGLGFVPNAIAASGNRVWLVGGANGPGPSRVQLAFIDSPSDPFAKTIEAQTFLATSSRAAEALLPFGRTGDSVLLVAPATPYPAAAVEAPVLEPLTLTFTGLDAGDGFTPSAVSGKRLVVSSAAAQSASFALIDNAGAASAAVGPVATYSDAGAVSTQRTFAQSADGVVFWATAVQAPPAPPDNPEPSTRAVRGYFLIGGETKPVDPAQVGVDVEVYAGKLAANAPVFGSNQATAAMVDSNTAMIAAQAKEAPGQTSVQFVSRSPLGLVKDGAKPRRVLLTAAVNTVLATAGSNGVGYVVVDKPGTGATVYVLDSACAP